MLLYNKNFNRCIEECERYFAEQKLFTLMNRVSQRQHLGLLETVL